MYIKDVFDDYGDLYNIEYFLKFIEKKNNILCEWLKWYLESNCFFVGYVKIESELFVLFKKKYNVRFVKNLKSRFY